MSNEALEKHPETANAVNDADTNSSLAPINEAAARRLVRKTDLILMPPLGMYR
jgi:hypothetical protein